MKRVAGVDPQAEASQTRKSDLGRYVSRLANLIYKRVAEEVGAYDLSPFEVQVLMICRERGESTATQLARLLPIDASRISRLVTILVDRDLLIRRRLRRDRRIVMLRLSPHGEQMISRVGPRLESVYSRLTDGLSEREMEGFASIAQRIEANSEAMAKS